jgi:hypothetical protein
MHGTSIYLSPTATTPDQTRRKGKCYATPRHATPRTLNGHGTAQHSTARIGQSVEAQSSTLTPALSAAFASCAGVGWVSALFVLGFAAGVGA